MATEVNEEFLRRPRLGTLITNSAEGTPVGIPLWYEWDGRVVRMFADRNSPKIERLRKDPRASVLVANHLDEIEYWVAFDGEVSVEDSGGLELAERLARHYWDVDEPRNRRMLESWRENSSRLCLLTLTPSRIRSGS